MKHWFYEFKYTTVLDEIGDGRELKNIYVDIGDSSSMYGDLLTFQYSPQLQIEKIELYNRKELEYINIPIDIINYNEEQLFQYTLVYDYSSTIELKVMLGIIQYFENVKSHLIFSKPYNRVQSRCCITGNE